MLLPLHHTGVGETFFTCAKGDSHLCALESEDFRYLNPSKSGFLHSAKSGTMNVLKYNLPCPPNLRILPPRVDNYIDSYFVH